MKSQTKKKTTGVLLDIPTDVYSEYLETLKRRGLRRQAHNNELFIKAIKEDIQLYGE